MNHPDFTDLRRQIDEAITFHDLDKARALAHEGLTLAGERELLGEVMYFRAQLEIIAERFIEAIEYLDRALEYNPTDGAAYNDLALCLIELGDLDGVEALFDEGIAVEPDYASIYHNKGWYLNKIGRHKEALVLFEKTLTLDPLRPVTYENMADALESLGQMSEALQMYKKALALVKSSSLSIREQIQAEIERLEKGKR